jgi:hypothetical protein
MYEYEFWCEAEKETYFFYAYSLNDLRKRNPDIDWDKLQYIGKEYID